VLKGCYPSLHRSRLPPIFSLPFLLLCPVRWFLYVYWTHTFKKFVKLDKRWECKREETQIYFFSSIRTKRREKQKLFASVQWLSQFQHNEMHITSLIFFSMLWWLLSSESYQLSTYIYIWILYLILNIGSIWARQFLLRVVDLC